MSAVFDVRCDRCGERGPAPRMDLVGGICFYCREEKDLEYESPESNLLAALEPLVASLEYDMQHGLLFGLVEPTERRLVAARAAIARAKEKP